jgi:hypothetical protein
MERTYQVTYACDSLDPNPVVKTFSEWYELQDWITEEVERRVQFFVDHSPFMVTEQERLDQEQIEHTLLKIEEV